MNGIRRIRKRATWAEIRRGRPTSRAKKSRKNQTPAGTPENAEVKPLGLMKLPKYPRTRGVNSETIKNTAPMTRNLTTTSRNIHETMLHKIPANGMSGFQDDEQSRNGKNQRHYATEHGKVICSQLAMSIKGVSVAVPIKRACRALAGMCRKLPAS